jgi:hypothetical protein
VGATYSSPDSALTRITVVYRCRCGAVVSEVGREAGHLPEGWEPLGEDGCMCEHCAEFVRAGKLPSARPS